jgi:hypothetical protein
MNLRLTQQPEDRALTPENAATLRARLERVLGRPVEQIERTRGGGYTPALRLRVTLRGNPGTSVFIKHALQTLPRPS